VFKIPPNSFALSSAEAIDPKAAERAFDHYNLATEINPKRDRTASVA